MQIRVIPTSLLIAMSLIFVLQNTQVVEIRFLFWTLTISRVLLVLGIGWLVGWLAHGLIASKRARQPWDHGACSTSSYLYIQMVKSLSR